MILNTLRLSNYKQYSHLELAFREGLVGIIGKNGAGKSTIFEAILYCLLAATKATKPTSVRHLLTRSPRWNCSWISALGKLCIGCEGSFGARPWQLEPSFTKMMC
ncbi:MAG: AAA family ATPase [Lewinellaceae bacterium]|nr:AAA family ATPase [Lewinellaceae bacterium]